MTCYLSSRRILWLRCLINLACDTEPRPSGVPMSYGSPMVMKNDGDMWRTPPGVLCRESSRHFGPDVGTTAEAARLEACASFHIFPRDFTAGRLRGRTLT